MDAFAIGIVLLLAVSIAGEFQSLCCTSVDLVPKHAAAARVV